MLKQATMKAALLPGNSTAEIRTVPVAKPEHGEVLIAVKASTICRSDIRAIYHEHLGKGPEGYQGVIAGHEPSGQIVAAGSGCRKLGAEKIIGIDISAERREITLSLGLCDTVLAAGPANVSEVHDLTGGYGVERAVDCSANAEARSTAVRALRKWGKMVMVGEGRTVTFNPSPDIIHDQKIIFGSWLLRLGSRRNWGGSSFAGTST